jgi:hypothetical protein
VILGRGHICKLVLSLFIDSLVPRQIISLALLQFSVITTGDSIVLQSKAQYVKLLINVSVQQF